VATAIGSRSLFTNEAVSFTRAARAVITEASVSPVLATGYYGLDYRGTTFSNPTI
jgi:hypothetical protein